MTSAAASRSTLRPATIRTTWVRPALWLLLAGTAALYLVNLGDSGYANTFYAAAVQAGAQSWRAWLFGSLDSAGGITVDKPPAALWVMGLSARIFGFSGWSMLVPQALEGVGAVALLFGAVRRWSGPVAGLLAAAALALTPVAALMFRYNNPDALLVLLLVAGAYCVVRATERGSGWWLALAGTALGFGFLTKMLQAFLVLPAFALVYLVAAPIGLGRRIGHLLGAGLALLVSAGWFVALVQLWPAADRPYIGGSTDNSLLQLALGYNGFGRILGGSGNGGGGGAMFGGDAGLGRLFGSSMGVEISWLLPAALIGLVAGLWFTRRAPRTDRTRAALLLWGGWLLVTGLVFSVMQGTIHPYYTVALAPAIAALVAVAGRELWRGRAHFTARAVLALLVLATGVWGFVLLDRTPDWAPALRWVLVALAVLVATALLMGAHRLRTVAVVLVAALVLTGFGGTAAYAAVTAAQPHTGPIPTSGPGGTSFGGVPGGGPGGGFPGGGADGGFPGGGAGGASGGGAPGSVPGGGGPQGGNSPDVPQGGGQHGGGQQGNGEPGTGQQGNGQQGNGELGNGELGNGQQGNGELGNGQQGNGQQGSGARGGSGGPGAAAGNNAALTALLRNTGTKWAAATVGAQSAAPLELSTGKAVLAVGGFSGTDNAPTLAQFRQYVYQGQIRYFVAGGRGPGGDGGAAAQITSWVTAHFAATAVGGQTVYDLAKSLG